MGTLILYIVTTTMSPNAFIGRTKAPTDAELSAELGAARVLWDELLAELALPIQEWNSYSPKAGWSMKVKQGKRTILYLAPCHDSFRVAFILGREGRGGGAPVETSEGGDEDHR